MRVEYKSLLWLNHENDLYWPIENFDEVGTFKVINVCFFFFRVFFYEEK